MAEIIALFFVIHIFVVETCEGHHQSIVKLFHYCIIEGLCNSMTISYLHDLSRTDFAVTRTDFAVTRTDFAVTRTITFFCPTIMYICTILYEKTMKEVSNQIPNKLILAKYSTSSAQRKIIYSILMQIEKVMEYTPPNEDPEFEVPKSIIVEGKENNYISKICIDLCKKEILLNQDNPDVEVDVLMPFQQITSLKSNDFIHVTLNRKAAGIFYEIKKGYSKIDYHSALSLNSLHAQKLYEIFSMKINGYDDDETAMWCTTVDEVKKILDIEGKYKEGKDFKKRVLEVTKTQLENTDLEISYDLEKKGRRFHFLTFYISRRMEKSDFEEVEIALEDDKSKRCLAKLIDLGIFDKKLQKTIVEQHQQAFWKWNHAVKVGAIKPKSNPAGYLLKTLGLK